MTMKQRILTPFCMAIMLAGCGGNDREIASADQNAVIKVPTNTVNPSRVSAARCPSTEALGRQFDAVVPSDTINADLFDAAVLHYTNLRRCANGVPPVAGDAALRQSATFHSDDMAALNFFSHTSPVPGRTSLQDRLKFVGFEFQSASENIAQRARLQLISGRSFTVNDRATCNFSYDGQTIQPHTYRTMARDFVQAWEDSPGHRKNMFNPAYTRLGTGGSFKPNSRNCGDVVATQNFAS